MKISRSPDQPDRSYVLIIEPDPKTAQRMVGALGLEAPTPRFRRRADAGQRPVPVVGGQGCVLIGTLRELFERDLDHAELVICAVNLPDGSGLNALDFLRGRFPHLLAYRFVRH